MLLCVCDARCDAGYLGLQVSVGLSVWVGFAGRVVGASEVVNMWGMKTVTPFWILPGGVTHRSGSVENHVIQA